MKFVVEYLENEGLWFATAFSGLIELTAAGPTAVRALEQCMLTLEEREPDIVEGTSRRFQRALVAIVRDDDDDSHLSEEQVRLIAKAFELNGEETGALVEAAQGPIGP